MQSVILTQDELVSELDFLLGNLGFFYQFEVSQLNARASVGVFMKWKWIRPTTENQSLWVGGGHRYTSLASGLMLSQLQTAWPLFKESSKDKWWSPGFFFVFLWFLRGRLLHAECRQRPRGDASCEGCLRQSVTHRCPLSICFIWELKRLRGPEGSPFEAPLPVLWNPQHLVCQIC